MRAKVWRRCGAGIGAAALAGGLAAPAAGAAAGGTTERVSVSSAEAQTGLNRQSVSHDVSGDGRYVVFYSGGTNLVAGDTNAKIDVFLRDRVAGTTERVSVTNGGRQANGTSVGAAISADGRYVAFRSDAPNLVAGDTNSNSDIFVRDRAAGTTTRVSLGPGGRQANGYSFQFDMSADGRYVAFESAATNLVPGDTNGADDIFVRDRVAGTTARASVASDGTQANGSAHEVAISADGRAVAFRTQATNLAPGDVPPPGAVSEDVFVHDRQTRTTEAVSVGPDGTTASSDYIASTPALSADGRYVAFVFDGTNLVPGGSAGGVYLRDRTAGTTTQVAPADSNDPSFSADARYLAFMSSAPLVAGDTNGTYDVYVLDRQTNATTRASVAGNGAQANGRSFGPTISADGLVVAFTSHATNLVPGDTNNNRDAFVRVRAG